ncbi:LysE family translocator [Aureimonas mangrovi]|uniref:LysE family translocator n=1 Tax=Aureimonas mangrovi TaxID=2758041 RepID=UPI00163D7143|nr:LysE family translocator [Aureimonas mangrovi]
MAYELFLALATFAFVGSVTPGPNNFMLMTSGVNFGFRRTVPHMFGIAFGFCVLLLAVGFGLGALLHAYPALEMAMKIASAAYLAWLAWKIAFSSALGKVEKAQARPMTFMEAAVFQWINPKAWAMALVAMGAYASAESPIVSVLLVAATVTIVGFPSVSIWTGFGMALRRFLEDQRRLRIFNIVMGVLLLLTIWPLVAN